MNRINKLFTVACLSGLMLLQAGCSKREPAKPESAAIAPTAKVAEPKAMAMPMAKDTPAADKSTVHHVAAVVKSMDAATGTVSLAHGPVATLNWPAMTMGFKVKDKALMNKLAKDTKVEVDFVQDGSDYVVTSVK